MEIETEHLLLGILRELKGIPRVQDRQHSLDEVTFIRGRAINPPFRFVRTGAVDPMKIVLVPHERREAVELACEPFAVSRIGECVRVGALSFRIAGVGYVYEGPMKPLRKIRPIVESA